MKSLKSSFLTGGLVAFLSAIFVFAGVANALEIVLEPANVAREMGDKVRVRIYADNAVSLVSMGVKVSFDTAVLEVVEASKYEDVENGWLMDADGDPLTTDDQYNTPAVEMDNTGGTVTMIGGHLAGPSSTGLNGKVLLGWIVFKAKANGNSYIRVDLGKYHPEHPTEKFDNFVNLDKSVDEPTNLGDLGVICVVDNVCYGDISGDGIVDMADWLKFGEDWGRTDCNDPGVEPCECDLNGDGRCDMEDWLLFGEDWGRTDCPMCP